MPFIGNLPENKDNCLQQVRWDEWVIVNRTKSYVSFVLWQDILDRFCLDLPFSSLSTLLKKGHPKPEIY